jgi:hypothetical protein
MTVYDIYDRMIYMTVYDIYMTVYDRVFGDSSAKNTRGGTLGISQDMILFA